MGKVGKGRKEEGMNELARGSPEQKGDDATTLVHTKGGALAAGGKNDHHTTTGKYGEKENRAAFSEFNGGLVACSI